MTAMEHDLQVEVGDGGTGRAHVIAGRDRVGACLDERPIHRPEPGQDIVAVAVETRGGGGREHGVALQFDDHEVGLKAVDDVVQQRSQDTVRGRDPAAEVDTWASSTPLMNPV